MNSLVEFSVFLIALMLTTRAFKFYQDNFPEDKKKFLESERIKGVVDTCNYGKSKGCDLIADCAYEDTEMSYAFVNWCVEKDQYDTTADASECAEFVIGDCFEQACKEVGLDCNIGQLNPISRNCIVMILMCFKNMVT